jgi:hypothetical protein
MRSDISATNFTALGIFTVDGIFTRVSKFDGLLKNYALFPARADPWPAVPC